MAPQAVGSLIFGDQANAHNWFLDTGTGGTLDAQRQRPDFLPPLPSSNQTATIGALLAGTRLIESQERGSGTLVLVESPGYDDGTTNNAGVFELLSSLNTSNNFDFNDPLVINGIVESAATLNLDVAQNDDSGSTNVLGAGMLRLIATNNSSASPDLFFAPDAVANDYYGAALDVSNLDLGDGQRYIFALTEHNAVARYDPYEDARIDANIIGTGGITYIAQNTYGGASPMECQLVLAGSNSFTGEVEIQRGSIYLFNPWALVQTNKLLFDPAQSNNARLFLYGNGATVENLESSGAGDSLIANGNVNNPITIAPATLTVIETSNTVFGGILTDGQYEYDIASGSPPGPLSLVKTGPGTLTLTGASTYSGFTSNASGELVISATQTGGGPFSVADGATLGITGIYANSAIMSDLALGESGDTALDFIFAGKPVTFLAPITTATLEANGGANSVTINIYTNGSCVCLWDNIR